MINLLPPEVRESITYARRNVRLLKWAFAMGIGILGIAAVIVFGQLYIKQSIKSYTADIEAAREQLKVQKLEETQTKVESISSSLKLVVQVLSKQVAFPDLIKQIGAAMPANTALTDLRISQLQGGIDLTAIASDYNTASQIQVNLQDPENQIFEKADIVNIACSGSNESNSRYPCTVSIRALFAKDNKFLFLSPSAGATP